MLKLKDVFTKQLSRPLAIYVLLPPVILFLSVWGWQASHPWTPTPEVRMLLQVGSLVYYVLLVLVVFVGPKLRNHGTGKP